MSLNPGRPDMRVLNNIDTFTAGPGDIVSIVSPGGGGRGDPLDREPERVLRDVICNYVAIADAEAEYGVVLTGLGDDRGVDLQSTCPRPRRCARSAAATSPIRTSISAPRARPTSACGPAAPTTP